MSPFIWLLLICRFQETFTQIPNTAMLPDDDRNEMSDLLLTLMKELILNGRQKIASLDKGSIVYAVESGVFARAYVCHLNHERDALSAVLVTTARSALMISGIVDAPVDAKKGSIVYAVESGVFARAYVCHLNHERDALSAVLVTTARSALMISGIVDAPVDAKKIRHATEESAPFEIGYITQTIHETYRRMIDNWHSTMLMPYGICVSSAEVNDILKELSWSVKLKLFKDIEPGKGFFKSTTTPNPATTPYEQQTEVMRAVGVQKLIAARKVESQAASDKQMTEDDENDMRLKLFRLMYETVRDSDLKVKRAELIREHYSNSTAFEIGYLVGDITDKSNIVTDISMTLKRFQKEWKPIEHINAYEQIANQAIQINHLIDLVRVVNKRDSNL